MGYIFIYVWVMYFNPHDSDGRREDKLLCHDLFKLEMVKYRAQCAGSSRLHKSGPAVTVNNYVLTSETM
jgi:hypothetical protein